MLWPHNLIPGSKIGERCENCIGERGHGEGLPVPTQTCQGYAQQFLTLLSGLICLLHVLWGLHSLLFQIFVLITKGFLEGTYFSWFSSQREWKLCKEWNTGKCVILGNESDILWSYRELSSAKDSQWYLKSEFRYYLIQCLQFIHKKIITNKIKTHKKVKCPLKDTQIIHTMSHRPELAKIENTTQH